MTNFEKQILQQCQDNLDYLARELRDDPDWDNYQYWRLEEAVVQIADVLEFISV